MKQHATINFLFSEFDSPDVPNSGYSIDINLVYKLQQLRDLYGKPITIISGVRTIAHNISVGGYSNSSHLKGLAVDIAYSNSSECFLLIKLALVCGFNRIGLHNGAIHLDIDSSKPKNVFWNYY